MLFDLPKMFDRSSLSQFNKTVVKKNLPFFILVAFSIIFTFSFYGKALLHPDKYLFNDSGDALKNYFTYSYHIKHGSTYLNFEGMNYPYGENILYTDCHPVLATFIKLCSSSFSFFSTQSIGILNLILILSIFLTFITCYFLLRELGVSNWFSLLFSIGITLLSPQIFRLGGHLSLSYSLAIPLSWLLILKSFTHKGKLIYPILLFFNLLFWLVIHAYLGVIVIFFIILVAGGKFISDINQREPIQHYMRLFAALIIPLLLFYVFARISDTHTGRTDNPSGFFLYNAEFDDVFLPNHPPLAPVLNAATGNIIRQQWEAWSYVGFSTTLLIFAVLVLSIIRIFNKKKLTSFPGIFFGNKVLNISLVAACIVLLFALAFPFKQIPFLLEMVPIVKQFRATGRFTWPFYFAAMVFGAVSIQQLYIVYHLNRIRKTLIISLGLFAGILNITEGLPYHAEATNTLYKSKNIFNDKLLTPSFQKAIKAVNPDEFQAIISLPFFYQGSENFSRPRNEQIMKASIVLSYHTGIPLVCANLTRTSIRESKNIVQIVSPDFYSKDILTDMPSGKPFLVVRTIDAISAYEELIIRKSQLLYQDEGISLFSLRSDDLFSNNAQSVFDTYKMNEKKLFKRNQFTVSDDSSCFFYSGFENLKSDKPFRGKGGFQCKKKGKHTFAEFAPGTFSAGESYEISIWMYNASKDALNNWLRLMIEEYDEAADTWESVTCFPEQSEVINGNWSLVECIFTVKNPKNRMYIVLKGKDDSKGNIYADDLLVRQKDVDFYQMNADSGRLFYNNQDIWLKSK